MTTPALTSLMVQATGSHAGKSVFVAGLCRMLRRRGWRVAPFKPQNMANNAAVTEDGFEIARAQALQCLASGCEPCADMNPVLLKPQADGSAQLVVCGRREGEVCAKDYPSLRSKLLQPVRESYRRLRSRFDVVVVEGAGSPAEINLRAGDIANMGFACAEQIPVVVLGDVERGGSLAALCGTHLLLSNEERALVRGYVVNKFRGDVSLFDGALSAITERTGWTSFGVVPWFADLAALPDEDSLSARRGQNKGESKGGSKGESKGGCCVAVLRCPYASNVDDLDPLLLDENFAVTFVDAGEVLPAETDLVVLLGSKSVLSDLSFLRRQGWDIDLGAHVRRGGYVLGICGGYQMLGEVVEDAEGLEGDAGSARGLGLLAVETSMTRSKRLRRRRGYARLKGEGGRHKGVVQRGVVVEGYEMHKGITRVRDSAGAGGRMRGWLSDASNLDAETLPDVSLGVVSSDGRVMGCYWHGLFCGEDFRKAVYDSVVGGAGWRGGMEYSERIERVLEGWADHLEEHCDIAAMLGERNRIEKSRMGGRVVEGVGLENR